MATAIAHLLPDLLQHHSDMGQDLLLAIAPVSREFRQVARDAWAEKKGNYRAGTQPGVSVQTPEALCGLQEEDVTHLAPCAVLRTRHRSYHNDISMYRWQDALGVAFEKHGGPEGLQGALDQRSKRGLNRGGTAKAKRESVLERIVADFALDKRPDKRIILDVCCDQFLRNGKGGQRGMKARIERYIHFDLAAPPATGGLKSILDQYRDQYLASGADKDLEAALNASKLYEALGGCVNCLDVEDAAACLTGHLAVDEVVEAAWDRAAREKELREALAARGLELRSDSRLCERYIWFEEGNVQKLVDTMEEMRFYFAHTSYPYEIRYTSSQEAKNRALTQWVKEGGRPSNPELPLSLVRAVDRRVWKLKRAAVQ
ncbi:hypothetical protein KFL_009170010 [Klebsormidium nitens]|uniref:Uncharacterized protein n=1 Tax=Klebsormidium nitens TaxID=105231 RepID=A0A1Y1IS40_KLENI|nr:hypothetical protein KFL_009170010 [Klebsormidium nitens]|eukprot:GAQ92071.1 hypothetical protein KFL_009170010 [Klebsormidium nitens]